MLNFISCLSCSLCTMNIHTVKLLVFVFLIFHSTIVVRGQAGRDLKPVGATEYRLIEAEDNIINTGGVRRRLAPYELCLLCKCCAGSDAAAASCITMPCCFGIDCQLPNKPFGVCGFVPKTCNCTSCPA